MAEDIRILPVTTPDLAVKQAKEEIDKEREGIQHGLYCEWDELNRGAGKYFRFNIVNLFAGLSGHGKSYIINLINGAFLNTALNKNLYFIPVVFQFCFEMSAYNEILRSVSKDLGVSYSHLLSSEYNSELGEYNKISDKEYKTIENALKHYENKSILFFEISGNPMEILETVRHYSNYYNNLYKTGISKKPYKFVVNIDHTLLIENMAKEATIDLMAIVGKVAIILRKEIGAMVNLLGQLNNKIEDVKRLTNPALHYPQKSDIYAQGQLFNACDNVYVIHQPALLKIPFYGASGIPTQDLVHLIKLKSRHGKLGSIWFKNKLSEGKLECVDLKTLKMKESFTEDNEPYYHIEDGELPDIL